MGDTKGGTTRERGLGMESVLGDVRGRDMGERVRENYIPKTRGRYDMGEWAWDKEYAWGGR